MDTVIFDMKAWKFNRNDLDYIDRRKSLIKEAITLVRTI